jgi:hypothetical protein
VCTVAGIVGDSTKDRKREGVLWSNCLSEEMLNELGDTMLERMSKLRGSTLEKLHVKGRAAVLRAM